MTIIARQDVPTEMWDAFVEHHPEGWWFHTSRWLAYALAYTPGAQDQSFAVVDDDAASPQIVGLGPLVVSGDAAVHGGQPTPALLVSQFSADLCALIEARLCERYSRLSALSITRPTRDRIPAELSHAEQWETYVVDLQQDEAALWTGLRRSYHALIHRVERECALRVVGAGCLMRDIVREAHALHRTAAGRETRPQATWDHMEEWVAGGQAIIALARDQAGTMLGYAYAIKWKAWSYFASGATRRSHVAHALQWALIRALRGDGQTTHYEIGWGPRRGDTSKAWGIARFKRGFGGTPWTIVASRAPRHRDGAVV